VVSQVNDTCYDIGGGAPPIGIKVKDPMWNLKSNHKVCHSNICGNVHQKCNIQVSTIYPKYKPLYQLRRTPFMEIDDKGGEVGQRYESF
jgi:hypothetical protein